MDRREAPSEHRLRSDRWRRQLGLLPAASDKRAALQQQETRFAALLEQFPFPNEQGALEDEKKEGTTTGGGAGPRRAAADHVSPGEHHGSADILDPLTAMVIQEEERTTRLQQADLQYRKERALRKRGMGGKREVVVEEESMDDYELARATLPVIDKDLERLPPPSENPDVGRAAHDERRFQVLRPLLWVYTCQHPDPGYRQGMHEIASHLLAVLESEEEQERRTEQVSNNDGRNMQKAAYVYAILESLLSQLLPAYDAGPEPQPLPATCRRILGLVARHDAALHDRLQSLQTPSQLYLTRWIRLLFAREVDQVLPLWDVLFELAAKYKSWMTVVQATAAARLICRRSDLLSSPTVDQCLHYLMNVPTETNTTSWMQLTRQILDYDDPQTSPNKPPIVLPPVISMTTTNSQPLASRAEQVPASAAAQNGGTAVRSFSFSAALQQGLESALTQTETFKNRLVQEWETIQQEHEQNYAQYPQQRQQQAQASYPPAASRSSLVPQPAQSSSSRCYDDPLLSNVDWSTGTTSPVAAAAMPTSAPPTAASPRPQSMVPPSPSHPEIIWAQRLQSPLLALQEYCRQQQQHSQAPPVPIQVWHALGDLEVLRQDMLQHHRQEKNNPSGPDRNNR